MTTDTAPKAWSSIDVTQGEWAGWTIWSSDPFELHAGPFYSRREADGRWISAFRAEAKHMNVDGFMHGGCLMTFADYALFNIAADAIRGTMAVTASLNCEFIDGAQVGDLVEASGEVIRAGRSMVFARGLVSVGGRPLLTFSGIIKKMQPRAAA